MTTIEAGKWYRTPVGEIVRAVAPKGCLGWAVVSLSGHRRAWPAEQLTPWVPKVGDWVRLVTDDPADAGNCTVGKVRLVHAGIVSADGFGWRYGGLVPRHQHYHVEPCLPPAEKSSAAARAAAALAAAEIGALAPEPCKSEVNHNGTCPKCGGPAYVGLNDAECLSEKCEPPAHLGAPPHLTNGHAISGDPRERGWWAWGHGQSVVHPTREGAIARWREAVRRG